MSDTMRRTFLLLACGLAAVLSGPAWAAPVETWSTVTTNEPPLSRFLTTATYVPNRNAMVIFGGRHQTETTPGPWLGDTWALDLATSTWSQLATNGPSPQARDRASAVYDSDHDRLVVFGGYDGNVTVLDDVWLLDLGTQTWTQAAVTGPGPGSRVGHSALYDSAGHRMIVFGGEYYDDATGWHAWTDLWSLDLETMQWTELHPTGQPPQVSLQAAAYDSANGQFYIYGGEDDASTYYPESVWRLDICTLAWSTLQTSGTHPGPRDLLSLVHDPTNHRLIVYGGHYFDGVDSHYYGDLWALSLDTMTWTEIVPAGETPRLLEGHAAIHDGGQRMFVWGGLLDGTAISSDATFLLQTSEAGCTSNADCDDEDPCTIDSCDQASACVHEHDPACDECAITPRTPPDGSSYTVGDPGHGFPQRPAPTFAWDSNCPLTYEVEFSNDLAFRHPSLLVFPAEGRVATDFTPNPGNWMAIANLARTRGGTGTIYWRVVGDGPRGRTVISPPKSFFIERIAPGHDR
jgi:Galactose oxidase, central domain/Dictyostelium (slime mold) repeat